MFSDSNTVSRSQTGNRWSGSVYRNESGLHKSGLFSQHLSLELVSYLCVFPVLVSFHAVARVDHEELSSEVHASFVSSDLSLLTQHPVLGTASGNDDSVCVCSCVCARVCVRVRVCVYAHVRMYVHVFSVEVDNLIQIKLNNLLVI